MIEGKLADLVPKVEKAEVREVEEDCSRSTLGKMIMREMMSTMKTRLMMLLKNMLSNKL